MQACKHVCRLLKRALKRMKSMPSDGWTKYLQQNYKLFSPIIADYCPLWPVYWEKISNFAAGKIIYTDI